MLRGGAVDVHGTRLEALGHGGGLWHLGCLWSLLKPDYWEADREILMQQPFEWMNVEVEASVASRALECGDLEDRPDLIVRGMIDAERQRLFALITN